MCRALMCLLPLVVVLAVAGGVAYYFMTRDGGQGLPDIDIDWPTLEDWHREAPWNASSPEEAQRWENNGKGLQLELLNALDTEWYPYFELAVADWEAGLDGIDPLTLSTSVATPDSECSPVDGKLKVCNGDYGETGWNGINQILMDPETLIIISSTAKMNEYYLNHGGEDLKQYTMCHEIGHGFGLPHTDESFYNRDLGNCMDYTLIPSNNLHPDITNFEFLDALYGTANGATNEGGGGVEAQETTDSGTRKLPEWISNAWEAASNEFSNKPYGEDTASERNGWRMLRSHDNLRTHALDIGQGYSIVVNVILADEFHDKKRR